MRCPTCKEEVDPSTSQFGPFCSRRCKLIDLGKWLDGAYAIPGEPASEGDFDIEADPDMRPKPRR